VEQAFAGAIIVGAGSGQRMGGQRKAFLELDGLSLLEHSARRLSASSAVDSLVLVLHPDDLKRGAELIGRYRIVAVVAGGARRQDSVLAGMEVLPPCQVVLIHDAARPLVPEEVVTRVALEARKCGAALAACPVRDTLKHSENDHHQSADDNLVAGTLERSGVWAAQTPQGFRCDLYRELAKRAAEDRLEVTDDAAVFEHYQQQVKLVESPLENIKITWPGDLAMAAALLSPGRRSDVRIGTGNDIHLLRSGEELILGGVKIEHDQGTVAHSDGDVLCHALMDALLGAAALGDIGQHFPDTDPAYSGASSLELLKSTAEKLTAAGYRLVNVDATIYLEKPKLGAAKQKMAGNLAAVLQLDVGSVSVKAGTTEGTGEVGRGQAVACDAVALIESV
jgi:2-C-methyl-D-erythritol 4-phosphate cytidylyltransferase / 2-C-methyl-D-erythritol 2,4-cyclodiphosphate synthase